MTRAPGSTVDPRALADIGHAMMRLQREVEGLREQYRGLESASDRPDAAQPVARSDGEMYARLQHRMYRVSR